MSARLRPALSVPFHIYVSIGCRSLQSEVSSNARPQSLMWMRNFSNSLLLTCYGQTCTEKLIAHLPVVGCDLHTFHVNFSAQSATSSSSAFATAPKKRTKSPPSDVSATSFIEVSSVEFILQTFNPPFSYFELFSRFFAFFSSTLLLLYFLAAMGKFELRRWTIEQRWTPVILTLLLFYYDPFHPLVFLVNSWVPEACDYIFHITFLSALLLFWLCVYHGMRVTDRSFRQFYLPKLLVVGSIWLLLVSLTCWKMHSSYSDPQFAFSMDQTAVVAWLAALGVLGFIYLLFFLILVIRSCSELHALPYFGRRLRFLTVSACLVAIGWFIVFALRFDLVFPPSYRPVTTVTLAPPSTDSAPHSTASLLPSPMFRSALEVSVPFGLFLANALLIVIVYAPARNALSEANFKDNPIVSMINDSDEDVLFGSDPEDLQLRPVRRR
uniref:Transmembrane protein 181 n=1 Tax=Schistocephalus solidus TaxID=70667 RepID=A0A0X3PTE9_SCHSO